MGGAAFMFDGQTHQSEKRRHACGHVIAVFLPKLAKHLALIACLMIVGNSTGKFASDQLAIFLTVTVAALMNCAGCLLQRRISRPSRARQSRP
jgi:hypothetical protein